MLSDAHRRLHQYKDSLQVIADSLMVAPDQLSDAVEMWVKFKVESYKWVEDKSMLDWWVEGIRMFFFIIVFSLWCFYTSREREPYRER